MHTVQRRLLLLLLLFHNFTTTSSSSSAIILPRCGAISISACLSLDVRACIMCVRACVLRFVGSPLPHGLVGLVIWQVKSLVITAVLSAPRVQPRRTEPRTKLVEEALRSCSAARSADRNLGQDCGRLGTFNHYEAQSRSPLDPWKMPFRGLPVIQSFGEHEAGQEVQLRIRLCSLQS